jgi:predicted nucleotidyltransferase component of viral defense system
LDFSTNRTTIALEDIKNIFEDTPFLSVKKSYVSEATIKIEKLQFTGPLVLPNSLKIEIDFFQNVLLDPIMMKYNNVWGLNFEVLAMDAREICAEKIRAMSDRARYRDFFDLFLLVEKYNPDLDEIVQIISKKEIRRTISKAGILQNWKVVGAQKNGEKDQIYYSQEIDDEHIYRMINSLPFTKIHRTI